MHLPMTSSLPGLLQSAILLHAFFQVLVGADKPSYKVMLPEFDIKTRVADDDVDFRKFQDAIDNVTSTHLNQYVDSVLPETGHFSDENFQGVELESRLLHVFLGDEVTGNTVQKWLVQASFKGSANFIGTRAEAKTAEGDEVKKAFRDLLILGLRDEQYSLFEKQLVSNEALSDIESLDIIVDGEVIGSGSFDVPDKPEPSSEPKRKLTKVGVIAVIVCTTFVLVLIGFLLWVWLKKRKKRRKMRERARKRKESSKKDQDSFSPTDASDDDPDRWMDEWTKKITSIPLRDSTKPVSTPTRAATRRGQQNGINRLGSITEEGSVSESSFSSSAMSDEEERLAMNGQTLADFDLRYSMKSLSKFDSEYSITEAEEGPHANERSLADFDLEYSLSSQKKFDLDYSRNSQGSDMMGFSLAAESMFDGEDSMNVHDVFDKGDGMHDQAMDEAELNKEPSHQFSDVDTASPEDYEPRVMRSSMLFL